MAIGYEDQPPPPKHSIRRAKEAIPVASNSHWLLCSRGNVSIETTSIRHDLSQSKLVQSGFIQQLWRFIATQTSATCQTEALDNAGLRKNGRCWARLRKAKGSVVPNWKRESCGVIFTCLDFFRGGSEIWPTIWMLIHTFCSNHAISIQTAEACVSVIFVNEHFNILEKRVTQVYKLEHWK